MRVVQFGNIIRPHIGINDLGKFGSFSSGYTTLSDRLSDRSHDVGRIPRGADRRQSKRYVAVSAGRQNTLKSKLERRRITALGEFDALPRQCFRLAVKQGFGCQGGTISRSPRTAGRIAALTLLKSARLLCACFFRGHVAILNSRRGSPAAVLLGSALRSKVHFSVIFIQAIASPNTS
jgi:hypothetical protein